MANKDWTGNKKSTFVTLGASNHSKGDREENDYYATDPIAAKFLLDLEPSLNNIWECCCGEGHLTKVFAEHGKLGLATDLIDRGYGDGTLDFLQEQMFMWNGDIVTNPHYKYAQQFVEKCLDSIPDGRKVCMFLKLTFLEGKKRKKLFEKNPPKFVYVSSSRINCAKNGDFIKYAEASATAYTWFVWQKGYKGNTIIKWFN